MDSSVNNVMSKDLTQFRSVNETVVWYLKYEGGYMICASRNIALQNKHLLYAVGLVCTVERVVVRYGISTGEEQ